MISGPRDRLEVRSWAGAERGLLACAVAAGVEAVPLRETFTDADHPASDPLQGTPSSASSSLNQSRCRHGQTPSAPARPCRRGLRRVCLYSRGPRRCGQHQAQCSNVNEASDEDVTEVLLAAATSTRRALRG